jgi:transketolase
VEGPVYLRLRRGLLPVLLDSSKYRLALNQSYLLRSGTDVGLIASGVMTERALQAAALLNEHGIQTNVLHVPCIKPMDTEGILQVAHSSKVLISLDNHSIVGGLGSAVSEILAENRIAMPFQRVGLRDVYGKAASNAYLFRQFGLDPDQIAQTAVQLLEGNKQAAITGSWHQTAEQESGWGEAWKNK